MMHTWTYVDDGLLELLAHEVGAQVAEVPVQQVDLLHVSKIAKAHKIVRHVCGESMSRLDKGGYERTCPDRP